MSTIYTVRDNLKRTIAGKEALLESIKAKSRHLRGVDAIVSGVTIGFLEVNIDELYRILEDVEKCVEKDVEQSWRDNPDRMGGQFTQDEINNTGKWI